MRLESEELRESSDLGGKWATGSLAIRLKSYLTPHRRTACAVGGTAQCLDCCWDVDYDVRKLWV